MQELGGNGWGIFEDRKTGKWIMEVTLENGDDFNFELSKQQIWEIEEYIEQMIFDGDMPSPEIDEMAMVKENELMKERE